MAYLTRSMALIGTVLITVVGLFAERLAVAADAEKQAQHRGRKTAEHPA